MADMVRDDPETFYDWPEWAKDAVLTETEIHLGWRDRLRVLIRGRIDLTTKTFVPIVVPAPHKTGVRLFVGRIWPQRSQIGVVHAAGVGDEPSLRRRQ